MSRSTIVIDLGAATTLDGVSPSGEFVASVVAPHATSIDLTLRGLLVSHERALVAADPR
jgi:pantothenate kinase type III